MKKSKPSKPVNITIIPAAPGWSLIGPITDKGQVTDTYTMDIVAWRIETYENVIDSEDFNSAVYALCALCTYNGNDNLGIVQPDGKIIFPFDCWCDSKAGALEWFREREKETKKEANHGQRQTV